MTLDECVKMVKDDLDRFEKFYRKGMETTDYYDAEMPPEDWYEQFLVFLQMDDEE